MDTRRAGGIGLMVYGVATFLAFFSNAPGGNYNDHDIARFMAPGHMWAAFGLAYLGVLGALGLLLFGTRLRAEVAASADLFWGLAVAGTATSVVGWFVTGGVAVSMAEGGSITRAGVGHPVVYTLSEIGNLLAVCSPALFAGIAAILLATKGQLPAWLKVFSAVAGVCGILAPFFFTYFVFALWTVIAGAWYAASPSRHATAIPLQRSLV